MKSSLTSKLFLVDPLLRYIWMREVAFSGRGVDYLPTRAYVDRLLARQDRVVRFGLLILSLLFYANYRVIWLMAQFSRSRVLRADQGPAAVISERWRGSRAYTLRSFIQFFENVIVLHVYSEVAK